MPNILFCHVVVCCCDISGAPTVGNIFSWCNILAAISKTLFSCHHPCTSFTGKKKKREKIKSDVRGDLMLDGFRLKRWRDDAAGLDVWPWSCLDAVLFGRGPCAVNDIQKQEVGLL